MSSRRKFILYSSAFALAPAFSFASAEDKHAFPLFDAHLHFFTDDVEHYPMTGGIPTAKARLLANPNTVEKVLGFMDESGVEGCAGVQYRTAYGTDDSYLLDVASKHRKRIVPVVILDATKPGASTQLHEVVTKRGGAGLRLTGPEAKDGSDPWLNSAPTEEVWKTANALSLPVAIMYMPVVMGDGSEDSLKRIADLAAMYPHVTFVLDHLGWPVLTTPKTYGLNGMHAALKNHKNVYYKYTTLILELLDKAKIDSPDFVRALVDFYGAERILWGSDYGNSQGTYPELVKRGVASTAKLTPREKRSVLHDTGRSIYKRA